MTDSERLDFLQRLLDERRYTGRALLRWSSNGRGVRLHETSKPYGSTSVREAIDRFYAHYGPEAERLAGKRRKR